MLTTNESEMGVPPARSRDLRAIELLAEVREVVEAAESVDSARRLASSCLARWAGRSAVRWWSDSGGQWRPAMIVSATGHDPATSPSGEVDSESQRAAAFASASGTWTWIGDAGSPASPDAATESGRPTGSLLIPLLVERPAAEVVEIVGGQRPADDDAVELGDVARQIADIVRRRELDAELDLAQRRFRLAFDEAAIGMALLSPDRRFIDANASMCELLGRDIEELTSLGFEDVTYADDLAADLEHVHQMLSGQRTSYQTEKRYVRPDGSVIWGLLSVSLVRDDAGAPLHFISQIQDASEHKRVEQELERTVDELARKERRYRSLVEPSIDMIVRIGIDGRVDDLNHCAAAAIGRPRAEIIGQHVAELVPESIAHAVLDGVSNVSATGRPDEMWRQWLEPADGLPGWFLFRLMPEEPEDGSGYVQHVHLMASDITELVENEQRLSELALVDTLTGLSNRVAVFDRLQHAIDRLERRPGIGVAVAVIDLDRFKAINDTYGHAAGDDALQAVAAALAGAARTEDTVGRLGGDEFVVVFEDVEGRHQASELGRRLSDALAATTIDVGEGVPYSMSGSVGVAFSDEAVPLNDLIARADRAMYHAKNRGRGRSWTEDEDDRDATPSPSALLRELSTALSRQQFELHYQPIARIADCRVVGFEALLRWRHPVRGLVPPAVFLDPLFSTGQIVPVGRWVLRSAFEQLVLWERDADTRDLQLHVNLSPVELAASDFLTHLREQFATHPIDPARLSIEITEQALAGSVVSGSVLAEIASTGARLVLDDFGTGVSSLAHLRTRPLHGIKIDRSFVSGADSDERERAIAESVIQLGAALDIDVTAEGVETQEQADWLARVGCPHAQGWHIGSAQPVDQATELAISRACCA